MPWEAYYALWGPRIGRAVASWGTSPVDIIGGASNARLALGDYLAQLNPFRALGAPVPANDETTRAALNEIVPDEYDEVVRWQDLLLLTRHLDGQPPAVTGTIDEAHLNIVARETGEPVAWLRGRLSLYTQLFELSHAEESSDAARPDH